jgi:hypothetical protein
LSEFWVKKGKGKARERKEKREKEHTLNEKREVW